LNDDIIVVINYNIRKLWATFIKQQLLEQTNSHISNPLTLSSDRYP